MANSRELCATRQKLLFFSLEERWTNPYTTFQRTLIEPSNNHQRTVGELRSGSPNPKALAQGVAGCSCDLSEVLGQIRSGTHAWLGPKGFEKLGVLGLGFRFCVKVQ